MNRLEVAHHSWLQEKERYEKIIKEVSDEISKPLTYLPSPRFESKENELRNYINHPEPFDQDDYFYEIYAHNIAGVINMTLMELTNQLQSKYGGQSAFWTNNINDLATNVIYHSKLSIWELYKSFEKYLGVSPQFAHQLKKKRGLAKSYIKELIAICRIIDKSGPTQEQLAKIDHSFRLLKKSEEKYYGFIEVTQNLQHSKEASNVSVKGKKEAKNNLFMFLKPRQEKPNNTLANYNFRIPKNKENENNQKLLKGAEYEEFDNIFTHLFVKSQSQRQSLCSESSNTKLYPEFKEQLIKPMNQLRSEFQDSLRESKEIRKESEESISTQNLVFIWRKEYFYTFWGYPVKKRQDLDFLHTITEYQRIDYDIGSDDEYNEMNAQDLESEQNSSEDDINSQGSFVVEDDNCSNEEKSKRDLIQNKKSEVGYQRWAKDQNQMNKQYESICLFSDINNGPLSLTITENYEPIEDNLLDQMEGKKKNQILAMFTESEPRICSKYKIQNILRAEFIHVGHGKNCLYYRKSKDNEAKQFLQDQQTTLEIEPEASLTVGRQNSRRQKSKSRQRRNKEGNPKTRKSKLKQNISITISEQEENSRSR